MAKRITKDKLDQAVQAGIMTDAQVTSLAEFFSPNSHPLHHPHHNQPQF